MSQTAQAALYNPFSIGRSVVMKETYIPSDDMEPEDDSVEKPSCRRRRYKSPYQYDRGESIVENPDVRRFLQIHFTTHTAQSKIRSFGYFNLYAISPTGSKDKKTLKCIGSCQGDDIEVFVEKTKFRDNTNYYVTANSFKSPTERNADELFAMCNLVVDIDNHCDAADPNNVFERAKTISELIAGRFAAFAEDRGVPGPNSIVLTGRGLQLWWAFVPSTVQYKDAFIILAEHYCNTLRDFIESFPDDSIGFEIDSGASKNRVGLFRMPGTINAKVGIRSEVTVLSNKVHDLVEARRKTLKIPFQFKTPAMLADEEKRKEKWAKANGVKYSPKKRKKVIKALADESAGDGAAKRSDDDGLEKNFDNFAPVARARACSLECLVHERKFDLTGKRNNTLWLYYNECIKFTTKERAMELTRRMNSAFNEPLSDTEVSAAVSACNRPRLSTRSTKGYAIRNTTMIDMLDITEQEQDRIGLHPAEENALLGSGFYEILRNYNDTCCLREHMLLYFEIMRLMDLGFGPAELGRLFNIPRRTLQDVARYRHTYFNRLNELELRLRKGETYVHDRAAKDRYIIGQTRKYCEIVKEKTGVDITILHAVLTESGEESPTGVDPDFLTPITDATDFADISRTIAALDNYEMQAVENGRDPYGWVTIRKGQNKAKIVAQLKEALLSGSFEKCLGMAREWAAPVEMAAGCETWLQNSYVISSMNNFASAKCLGNVIEIATAKTKTVQKTCCKGLDCSQNTANAAPVVRFENGKPINMKSPAESGGLQKKQSASGWGGLSDIEWLSGAEPANARNLLETIRGPSVNQSIPLPPAKLQHTEPVGLKCESVKACQQIGDDLITDKNKMQNTAKKKSDEKPAGYWESLLASEPTDLGVYYEHDNGCAYHYGAVYPIES